MRNESNVSNDILSNESKLSYAQPLDVVCFGCADWWYHNRGHVDMQLMRRFARNGKVLYVNSVVVQKPKLGEGSKLFRKVTRKVKSILKGLQPSGEGFWVYSPFTLPMHHIRWARALNQLLLRIQINNAVRRLHILNPVVWVACPTACDTSIRLRKSKLVWQVTDRWDEYPNIDADMIREYDERLKAVADLTVFASSLLYQQEQWRCKKAFYLDHGVDYESFANAHKEQYIPQEMKQIQHPILGFYGGIDDHTSDIPLVEKLADLLSDFSIVLIGNSSVDLSVLASRKNVYLFGQKPYGQIPHYVKCFDVCFMPWRQNSWIEACNPVKLKEYLASGKPIVSTPFSELEHYEGLVHVASDAQSFAEAVRQACQEEDPKLVSARRERVRNCTWDAKAEQATRALFESNQRSVES